MKFYFTIFTLTFINLISQSDTTKYQWPVPPLNSNQGITGTFGEYRNTGSSDHFHNAVDIAEPDGNPVYPCLDGIIYSLINNGFNSYINVKSIINGMKKHMTYYHVVPNPNLAVGQQVYKGLTVLGTIYVSAGHVHLIEREFVETSSSSLGNEINPIRPEGGLTPFSDPNPPIIEANTIKFFKDRSNVEISSNQLNGNVDIRIKVRDVNGTNSSNVNNGTYILGYRILSEDGTKIIYEPNDNGVKYRFYYLPNDNYVNTVFADNVATLSDPVYWLTNGNGENHINSTLTVPNNFLNTNLFDNGNYLLEIFSEDTRGSFASKRFPIIVQKLPPKLKSVLVKNDSIEFNWEKYNSNKLLGYRIYYAEDENLNIWKLAADESVLNSDLTKFTFKNTKSFRVPSEKMDLYFYLTSIDSAGNESETSDIYAAAFSSNKKALIVDGFSRYETNSRWQNPQHSINTFYFNPLISNTNFSVSSCIDESIENEEIDLNNYDLIIWFVGDNSMADNTFVNMEQYKIALYLEQGGKILISGSNIGQDLDTQHSYSESSDTLFYHQYLKSKLIHDGLDILTELNGEENTQFENFNASFYDIAPDDIEPINGAISILNYNFEFDRDGLHRKGGIAFTGTFGESSKIGQMIYLSFPFEAIGNDVERQILMKLFLEYLNIIIVKIDEEKTIQNEFKLFQNFPNPFNPITTIEYFIPANLVYWQAGVKSETSNVASDFSLSAVTLKIYDILGREVSTLVNQKQKPGNYKIEFDAKNLASGVYYFQLKTHNFIQTKKMLLLK